MLGINSGLAYNKPIISISIGDTYQGGIVFYIDGDSGLVCAPSDQSSSLPWGASGISAFTNGVGGLSLGDGAQNTLDILEADSTTNSAAKFCQDLTLNGYSDWFLPSKTALDLMYNEIGQGSSIGNVGSFTSGRYWSSNELNQNNGRVFDFNTDTHAGAGKSIGYYVRAIRAF